MTDVTVKKLDDFQVAGSGFYKVRAGLGVQAFGLQFERFPPNFDGYPEHDHTDDGQEEVYIPIKGSAVLVVGGEEHRLEPGVFARVGAGERRKLVTHDESLEILCIGGTPGGAYAPPPFTEEGA
jgi:uncharacterized cupin superfamily protein